MQFSLIGWFAEFLLAVLVATVPVVALAAAPDAHMAQSLRIEHFDSFPLYDGSRKKDLLCRITIPEGAQRPCPVVIFSHGALGSKNNYEYVVDYWASQGYVCIQPSHDDSLTKVEPYKRAFYAAHFLRQLPKDASSWTGRARDITFIIDSLPAVQQRIPVQMDLNEIACGGHSLGAFTTALIAGAEVPPPAAIRDCSDPRVKAVIMMSPQGVRPNADKFGFADEKAWQRLSVPALFMTGTRDRTGFNTVEDRIDGFANCKPGDKYYAVINGASHMTFSGATNRAFTGYNGNPKSQPLRRYLADRLAEKMPEEQGNHQEMLDDICRVSTCFLNAYLKGDKSSKSRLVEPGAFGPVVDLRAR
jgi:predicted dienelactone hydrolase